MVGVINFARHGPKPQRKVSPRKAEGESEDKNGEVTNGERML